MKWQLLIIFAILFQGCNLFKTQDEIEQQRKEEHLRFEKKLQELKEVELKKIEEQTKIQLALLQSKKELANINKTQELKKAELQLELDKQKILLQKEQLKQEYQLKLKETEKDAVMEEKLYIVLLIALLILTISFFTYYYFKKRREDKLMAYNDNLKKYFHQKENEARLQIAEKILDTINSGHLDKEQENQLIRALSGATTQQETTPQEEIPQIEEKKFIEIEHK
ncbi:hypothetical protein MNB_SM-3-1305 [hydrothermal vent metagenome]|uniref:Uncharacterized protein n=1 Tax=hydrothermal vent metagenome TaxID=652676 RepID=A0A1W1D5K5_9ZZZZ